MRRKAKILMFIFFIFLAIPYGANANIGAVNGLTHERNAGIGETYETLIIIKNFGTKQGSLKIYQTDYYFHSDGSQFYSDAGKLERSNASWITFYPKRLVVPSGETAEIKCIVKVPAQETLSGTYWSMLMVEPLPDSATEFAPRGDKIQFGIKQVLRYGVQIITNIGDSGTREIKFLDTKLAEEGGKKILKVDVENIGERWLRPVLYVEIFDEKGQRWGKLEGEKWRIFPGSSVRYNVDLSRVPRGRYKAMIIADNLDEYVFGAEYTLSFRP
jgi:hypothetical protein